MPENDFPEVPGHDRLSDNDKAGIVKAAVAYAGGSATSEEINALIAGHVAGDIDLFRMPPKAAAPAA